MLLRDIVGLLCPVWHNSKHATEIDRTYRVAIHDENNRHNQIFLNPNSVAFTASFWATDCKTVRPMLSDRCLSCLSVTLVYCGQAVGWIKMKLGMQVGLGPGHIVLDGNPASPLPKVHSLPVFGPCLLWPNGRPS